jgi:aspartate 1-decarboxylase
VILATYATIVEPDIAGHQPQIVHVDRQNRIEGSAD